jgi:S-DNA-T family DNA segregation ATPase FtsK/SpoIIIE
VRFCISVFVEPGLAEPIVADLAAETTVGMFDAQLRRQLGHSGVARGLWIKDRLLDAEQLVSDLELCDGDSISLAGPEDGASVASASGLELRVVGGPLAGSSWPLQPGETVVGRAQSANIRLLDSLVSREHVLIEALREGLYLSDIKSTNGALLDSRPLSGRTTLSPGQLITVGNTVLTIASANAVAAVVPHGLDGTLEFSRAPRMLPPENAVRLTVPIEPQPTKSRSFPLVAILVPLALGIVLAVVSHSPQYLLFALMSPLIFIGNAITDRRSGRRSYRDLRSQFEKDRSDYLQALAAAERDETAERRHNHPDPGELRSIATLRGPRLWERRRWDDDFLDLRVGLGEDLSGIELQPSGGPRTPIDPPILKTVPIHMGLREVAVLGIAGPVEQMRACARWLIAQIATQHSPRDVSLALLTEANSESDWDWIRWLPHARPSGLEAGSWVANDAETLKARVAEILAMIRDRKEDSGSRPNPAAYSAVVLILDGARRLRSVPGVAQILVDGPSVGIYAICLEQQERLLPEECTGVVLYDLEDSAYVEVRRHRGKPRRDVLVDQVSVAWMEATVRKLAPLRDVTKAEGELALPDAARLLDLIDMAEPTADAIRARWLLRGRSTRAVIGSGTDGTFELDLRADGPHGLIAGTTGSGKSELLQTIVASLAVANRPDAMNFVLVDYKGGSAFKDCVRLPHTVGMVTDLDTHLVGRALTSLSAELRRREHLLADAAVKDIEDYTRLSDGGSAPSLPRLVLVIDEFASLARELPDFVSGLVNIAQRGRSLGIHLLLATQRPSGVVSPEIRANTNLRIALRVTDTAESQDVLDAPDAGLISPSTPGRAYARTAHSSLTAFQSGRVGGRRPGALSAEVREPFVASMSWQRLGYSIPRPMLSQLEETAETDSSVLVSAISRASDVLEIPGRHSPWLPALPESLMLEDLPESPRAAGDLPPIAFGMDDLPAEQQQPAAVLDLAAVGHFFAVGSARSGRSQLLRTIAGSAAKTLSCADLHIYGLDCGNGALLPLTDLPHCGAVVTRTQIERVERLLRRLVSEVERRQELLATAGFADVTEQRVGSPAEQRLPHILLLLDRWESFTSSLGDVNGGALSDAVQTLLREGASVGLHVIATGDKSLVAGRMGAVTEHKVALRLADRTDFTLLGLSPRKLPEEIAPGRLFRAETGVETQIAILDADVSGQAQARALAAIALAAGERDAEVANALRPFRVDVLPSKISFEQVWAMRRDDAPPLQALIGVGGDDLVAYGPDLSRTAAFIVAGPPKSGRSSLLRTMARSLLAQDVRLIIAAPRPSRLRDLAGENGVLGLIADADISATDLAALLDKAGDQPVVVVMDDAELYRTCDAAEELRAIINRKDGLPRSVLMGGSADDMCSGFSGWQVEAKKARQGALLSPQSPSDGDLIGVRLPRGTAGAPVQVGRAMVHLGDGVLRTLQLPTD